MNFTDTLNAQFQQFAINDSTVPKKTEPKPVLTKKLALISAEELDKMVGGVQFKIYMNYKLVKNTLIANLEMNDGNLVNIFLKPIPRNVLEFTPDWIIDQQVSFKDHLDHYQSMNIVCMEWLCNYAISSNTELQNRIREAINTNLKLDTFHLLDLIVSKQNLTSRLSQLLAYVVNLEDSEQHARNGYLAYVTYMQHVEENISALGSPSGDFQGCKDPFRTITMLQMAIRKMDTSMFNRFLPYVGELLYRYPDFTMGQFSQFLKEKHLV